MRGPQIMRKVCCSRLLRPNRKVKGTALTASNSILYVSGPQIFEFGAAHDGKAKSKQGWKTSWSLSHGSDGVRATLEG